MRKSLLLTIFSFLLLTPFMAMAQFSQDFSVSVGLSLSPKNPGPNQSVTATLESYATDLNGAKIVWSVNDKVIDSGTGIKSTVFNTGDTNTETTLSAEIYTVEGEVVKKVVKIVPTSVDLIWQAEGYTPPFYKGKTLFGHEDLITFMAVPHLTNTNGKEIPAESLIYKWTKNGTVMGDFNGYGKNTYSILGSIISRPLDIEVEVSTTDGTKVATNEVVVSPISPQILFYKNDPLYGINFEHALKVNVDLSGLKEFSVTASPFYFGTKNPSDSSLSYSWNLNDHSVGALGPNMTFGVPTGDVFGSSNISLTISSLTKVLQEASGYLTLKFEKTQQYDQ